MSLKKKIINATANVLSAQAQIKSALSQRQSTKDFNTLRTVRSYKGAPDYDNSGMPTNANKARSLATDVKTRLNKRSTSDGYMSK